MSDRDPIWKCLQQAIPGGDVDAHGWAKFGQPAVAQGWKLHVSATPASAQHVLEQVLPILIKEDVPFKVAATTRFLQALNRGRHGASQVGKFVTVYPRDDVQAVRLALALDRVTVGLGGPPVPSDRPLRPGSLVHYRYGGLTSVPSGPKWGRCGRRANAIRDPEGNLISDVRTTHYAPPPWANDPFQHLMDSGKSQATPATEGTVFPP